MGYKIYRQIVRQVHAKEPQALRKRDMTHMGLEGAVKPFALLDNLAMHQAGQLLLVVAQVCRERLLQQRPHLSFHGCHRQWGLAWLSGNFC